MVWKERKMKSKAVSGIMLTLLLMGMLLASFGVNETLASPTIRFYVKPMHIPAVAPGDLVIVELWIDSPPDADIVAWTFDLSWNPDVLYLGYFVASPPPGYWFYTLEGDFLKNWCTAKGWTPGTTYVQGSIDQEAGNIRGTSCGINSWTQLPWPGPGGSGNLAYLYFTSLSETDYSLLDLFDCEYGTTEDVFPVDVVEDGHYNTQVLLATIDIDPDTLNLGSKGQWITAYIELPEEYNAEDVDVITILLNGTISPVLDPMYEFATNSSEYLVDHDEDGILERMVKFDKAEVMASLSVGETTLAITGEVNGTPFEGSDSIRVISPSTGSGGFKGLKK